MDNEIDMDVRQDEDNKYFYLRRVAPNTDGKKNQIIPFKKPVVSAYRLIVPI